MDEEIRSVVLGRELPDDDEGLGAILGELYSVFDDLELRQGLRDANLSHGQRRRIIAFVLGEELYHSHPKTLIDLIRQDDDYVRANPDQHSLLRVYRAAESDIKALLKHGANPNFPNNDGKMLVTYLRRDQHYVSSHWELITHPLTILSDEDWRIIDSNNSDATQRKARRVMNGLNSGKLLGMMREMIEELRLDNQKIRQENTLLRKSLLEEMQKMRDDIYDPATGIVPRVGFLEQKKD